MSAINPSSVDRDFSLNEKIEEISRECAKMYDELVKTLDKSNRVAHIVLDLSQVVKQETSEQIKIFSQQINAVKITFENQLDSSINIFNICKQILYGNYRYFPKTASNEALFDAKTKFTVELRDVNNNLLKDHVWNL